MKITNIPKDKLLLLRWKDILELHDGGSDEGLVRDEEDYDRLVPILELMGRIKTVRRGIIVVETEWNLMKDYDEYSGSGPSTQLIPIGCIDSIFELKIGKCIYQNPDYREEPVKKDGTVSDSTKS